MSSTNSTSISLAIIQLQSGSFYSSLILGFILLIGGVLGNILNIIVFIKTGNYKNNACSLYMFVHTFLDLYILLTGFTTRILATGFQIDFTLVNRIWCKTRASLVNISIQSTYTLICLQAIDAFMCSSPSVVIRQKSNIQIARYLIIVTLCFWSIHEIPYFIFQDLVIVGGTPMCIMTNKIYAQYRTYVDTLGIITITPIIVISIFGFLTVRHMKTISITRSLSTLTRQTISMALFQIIALLVFNSPFATWDIYLIITTNVVKDTYRRAVEQLITSFISTYGYGPYASSFYCYCLSKRFRNQLIVSLKEVVGTIHMNQVFPSTHRTGTRTQLQTYVNN